MKRRTTKLVVKKRGLPKRVIKIRKAIKRRQDQVRRTKIRINRLEEEKAHATNHGEKVIVGKKLAGERAILNFYLERTTELKKHK